MKKLILFPFNGNAMEALLSLGKDTEAVCFVDDYKKNTNLERVPPIYSREAFQEFSDAKVLAVPGSPKTYLQRKELIQGLNIAQARFATVIDSRAAVSPLAKIGKNVLIMAGVVVSSNAVIGDHVVILPNTVIHHDTIIGDYTLIGSNVTIPGGVKIEENCYIGSGSSLMNDVSIGKGSLIGLGSTVLKSVPENSKVAGNPARAL